MANAIMERIDYNFLLDEKYRSLDVEFEDLKEDFDEFMFSELFASRRDILKMQDMNKIQEIASMGYDTYIQHRLSVKDSIHANAHDSDEQCRDRWLSCFFDFEDLMEKFGYYLSFPSYNERFKEKYSILATKSGKKVKIRLRARMKIDRQDMLLDDEFLWIESTGVYGEPGWLYGKADKIVFEKEDGFLFVDREKLKNKIESMLDRYLVLDKKIDAMRHYIVTEKLALFQRWHRVDRIVLIPSKLVTELGQTLKKIEV